METDITVLHQLVDRLSSEPDKHGVLAEMLKAVKSLKPNAIQESVNDLQFVPIFECLASKTAEVVKITRDILNNLLNAMDSTIVIGRYGSLLQTAVGHPNTEVKRIAIKELLRASQSEGLVPLLRDQGFIFSTVPCLFSAEVSVAEEARRFFSKMCETPTGLDAFFSNPSLDCIKEYIAQNDESKIRCYELCAEIAAHSEPGLTKCADSGLLGLMLRELKTEDSLMQHSVLPLLVKIAVSDHGFRFLNEEGVLKSMEDQFLSMTSGPADTLMLPAYIKFFGNLLQARPSANPGVLQKMFDLLEQHDLDLEVQPLTAQTIGFVATSVEGKTALDGLGSAVPDMVAKLRHFAVILPLEYKVQILDALSNLIRLEPRQQTEEMLAITNRWFCTSDEPSTSPLDVVMTLCRQPFPELRLSCLQLINVLAGLPWGLLLIRDYPGLLEFLLDRSTENTKLCKEVKYSIMHTIVSTRAAQSIFSTTVLNEMERFVLDGPYYVNRRAEVDYEEHSA